MQYYRSEPNSREGDTRGESSSILRRIFLESQKPEENGELLSHRSLGTWEPYSTKDLSTVSGTQIRATHYTTQVSLLVAFLTTDSATYYRLHS